VRVVACPWSCRWTGRSGDEVPQPVWTLVGRASRASLQCGRHRRPHAVPAARLAATRAGGLIPILRVLSAFVMSRAPIRPFPVRSGAVC
jgi:hypothetical protein